MRRDPTGFRFAWFDRPQAPWRPTMEEALADAIEAEAATPPEFEGGHTWVTVPARILRTFDPVTTLTRGPARKKGPTSRAEPSRIDRIIARREAQKIGAF